MCCGITAPLASTSRASMPTIAPAASGVGTLGALWNVS